MKNLFLATVLLTAYCLLPIFSSAQGTWTQKADFSQLAAQKERWVATGFYIGNKGYIGTGYRMNAPPMLKDFWEYTPGPGVMGGSWTQKAPFGGTERWCAVGFSIGNKGYIGTGQDNVPGFLSGAKKDLWEYDPSNNSWTQKADLPGNARWFAVGFSIGAKGYIGMGVQSNILYQDFWEYTPGPGVMGGTWVQKQNFGGGLRYAAVGFSITTSNKGYVGTGFDDITTRKDFWEYDPSNDTWTKKLDFGGVGRELAVGFALNCKGYIGTGFAAHNDNIGTKDFWEYDPTLNTWTQKADFGGGLRGQAVGFAIPANNKGYIGTTGSGGVYDDFWEYTPDAICSALNIVITQTNPPCGAGQCSGTATVTATGTPPYTYNWVPSGGAASTATGLCGGTTYSVIVTDAASNTAIAAVTISSSSSAITLSVSPTPASCGGSNGIATAVATGGSPQYTYLWSNGATQSAISNLQPANYTVTVTDANGCTQIQTVTISTNSTFSINATSTPSTCNGATGTATATPNGGTAPYTYLWNPSGQITSAATAIGSGSYTVTITDVIGCVSTQTVTVAATGGPTATATAASAAIAPGDSTILTATGGITYSWSNGATTATVTVAPAVTTVYCVTVTDANTCTDNACVTVQVETDCSGELLFLPTAFSPNGDGQNDELHVYYGNIKCISAYKLTIYNRWGEKVFETTNPGKYWDGTHRDKPLSTAVFVYYMEATLTSGENITKKGNVSLLR